MKGNSTSHYLIELINFILYNQDNTEATAVLVCLVDFSKAFNRQDHSILITKLSDMGTPSWLLNIVIAFLKDRCMVVKYKGEYSNMKQLPGGGPQGALLGLFLFLILINDVGFNHQVNDIGEINSCKKRLRQVNELHLKYVDDLALAEAVSMTTQLTEVPIEDRPQPDTYQDRTGHELKPENSRVYQQLLQTKDYAVTNKMKINQKKTKLMLFNPGKVRDFMPTFPLCDNELELVEETTLLGVVLRSDLSWASNTDYMVKRAYKKLWCLRRLKKLGANHEDLLDVYFKQIRSILEYAVAVWHPALTGEDRLRIERVHKCALSIIKQLKLDTLFSRRQNLCKKFAKKSLKHAKFSKWFKPNRKVTITRQKPRKFCELIARTDRFQKSSIGFLTRLLNNL